MERTELARRIFDISHLTGTFLLRSGQTSSEYFDKYRFESNPEILKEIAKHMAPNLPKDIDYLAGLEMGGIPIATALSLETGIPVVFVRKEAKEYGTCQFSEGADIKGKKLCIIEDVITTGGQVVVSTEDLRKAGAEVTDVRCVIHRGQTPEPKLEKAQLQLTPLFTMEELKKSVE